MLMSGFYRIGFIGHCEHRPGVGHFVWLRDYLGGVSVWLVDWLLEDGCVTPNLPTLPSPSPVIPPEARKWVSHETMMVGLGWKKTNNNKQTTTLLSLYDHDHFNFISISRLRGPMRCHFLACQSISLLNKLNELTKKRVAILSAKWQIYSLGVVLFRIKSCKTTSTASLVHHYSIDSVWRGRTNPQNA